MDATVAIMNRLAQRLSKARRNALEQISSTGWPIDIYHDIAWYPSLCNHDVKVSQSPKRRKWSEHAHKLRDAVFQFDVALAALNHFAETTNIDQSSHEPEAIVEALEASIYGIEALFAHDAEIGKRQRRHGTAGGWNKDRKKALHDVHQAWAEEDNRLRNEKPRLSKSARAKRIAEIHNKRPENSQRQTTGETVRSALRRLAS